MLKEAYRLADESHRRICVFNNGLTAIALHHDAAPLVAARVYVRAGSVFEGKYLGSGISHLLEHLVTCDGAGDRNEADLLRIADEMGGLMNAYTSIDHLCYYGTAPVEQMDRLMGVLADYTIRPHLSTAVFERELGVVQRELERDRDDPDVQLEEIAGELAYRGHPLAPPIIGHRSLLTALTHSDLVDWYRRTHGGENAIVVIAGAVDPTEAMTCMAKHMSDLPRGTLLDTRLPEPSPFFYPRCATKHMQVESVSSTLQWRTVREGAPDDVALDVLSTILTDGDDSRLTRALRWDTGLVFDIGGTHDSNWHTPGVFSISTQFDEAKAGEVTPAIAQQIAALRSNPVTAEEVSRAVQKLKLSVLSYRQTAEGLASQVAEDLLALHDPNYSDRYLADLERIDAEIVQTAANTYLTGKPHAEARMVPMPTRKRSSKKKKQANETPNTSSPCSIPLKNGRDICVRSIANQPFVAVHIAFEGGLLHELPSRNGWFNLMTQLWTRGSANYSADEISESFARCGASLGASAGMNQFGLGFRALTEDVEQLLPIWVDVLLRPTMAADELEKIRPTVLDAIARQDEYWGAELMRFARQCLFATSPYRRNRRGTTETVTAATAEDLLSLHGQFVGGDVGKVAVAGCVDQEKLVQQLDGLLGGWTSTPGPMKRPAHVESVKREDQLFVKASSEDREVAGVFIGFDGIDLHDFQQRAAVNLFETMLAGYALAGGRLYQRLRGGADDLAYEVAGVGFAGLLPGMIGFSAGCQPERVNDVYHAMRDEIDHVRAGAFDDSELDRARAMIRMGELDQHQTAADLATRLAVDVALGLEADDLHLFLNEVATVSPETVRQVAAEMLTGATVCITTPSPDSVELGGNLQRASLIP